MAMAWLAGANSSTIRAAAGKPGQVRNQQLPVGAGYRAIPRPRMRDNNFTRHRGCLGPCAADTVAVRDNVNIDAVGDLIVVTD